MNREVRQSAQKGIKMNQKDKPLTIGQFAALHGINKKTLMWYDEIGLFGPASVNPENGYRCYNYHQSPMLETILLLRELEVPIPVIQDFMKNRSAENLKELLDKEMADLDLRITHLQALRTTLSAHRRNMATLLTMDLSEISVIEKKSAAWSLWKSAKTLPTKRKWSSSRPKRKNTVSDACTMPPMAP